eukprot:scaffold628256_cov18-Prasinocladus_malaysianus.AAC.1
MSIHIQLIKAPPAGRAKQDSISSAMHVPATAAVAQRCVPAFEAMEGRGAQSSRGNNESDYIL